MARALLTAHGFAAYESLPPTLPLWLSGSFPSTEDPGFQMGSSRDGAPNAGVGHRLLSVSTATTPGPAMPAHHTTILEAGIMAPALHWPLESRKSGRGHSAGKLWSFQSSDQSKPQLRVMTPVRGGSRRG